MHVLVCYNNIVHDKYLAVLFHYLVLLYKLFVQSTLINVTLLLPVKTVIILSNDSEAYS